MGAKVQSPDKEAHLWESQALLAVASEVIHSFQSCSFSVPDLGWYVRACMCLPGLHPLFFVYINTHKRLASFYKPSNGASAIVITAALLLSGKCPNGGDLELKMRKTLDHFRGWGRQGRLANKVLGLPIVLSSCRKRLPHQDIALCPAGFQPHYRRVWMLSSGSPRRDTGVLRCPNLLSLSDSSGL